MYIEPRYQLPEQAESLHTVDWQETMRGLSALGKFIGDAFSEVATAVGVIFQNLGETLEDATRDNAIHPQGPVIRSTGFGLPDDTPLRDQRLLQ